MNTIEIQLITISVTLLAILNVVSAIAVILLVAQNIKLKLDIKRLHPKSQN
jgi:hypothetical protein